MIAGIPKETAIGEKRVAITPDAISKLKDFSILVEHSAGEAANLPDSVYSEKGATIAPDSASLYAQADIVFKVQPPNPAEAGQMKEGSTLISFLYPTCKPRINSEARRSQGHCLCDGTHSQNQQGAVHGRALLAGKRLRLQGGPDSRGFTAQTVPDDDDRRRHYLSSEGLCHGSGSRRSAGDSDRPQARRRRRGLRRPPHRERADNESGGKVRRGRGRSKGRADRGRVCEGPVRRFLQKAAGAARRSRQRVGRDNYDRACSGTESSDSRLGGRGKEDAPGLRDS